MSKKTTALTVVYVGYIHKTNIKLCVREKERWLASPLTGMGTAFGLSCYTPRLRPSTSLRLDL